MFPIVFATGTLVNIWALGPVLYLSMTTFAIFFIFLWKGAAVKGVNFSLILALVLAVVSWVLGFAPQPYLWAYDNQTQVFTYSYMSGQDTPVYYGIVVFQTFLIMAACIRLMLSGLGSLEEVEGL